MKKTDIAKALIASEEFGQQYANVGAAKKFKASYIGSFRPIGLASSMMWSFGPNLGVSRSCSSHSDR